jgi:hypothetical protein
MASRPYGEQVWDVSGPRDRPALRSYFAAQRSILVALEGASRPWTYGTNLLPVEAARRRPDPGEVIAGTRPRVEDGGL